MKKIKLTLLVTLPALLLFLTGCYTQVATRDYDYGNWNREKSKPYYDYEENQDTLTDSYNDEYAYEDEDSSIDENGNEVNYYFYGFPSYRKYFWNYYPAVSIGIYTGWYYDPWWYWDPWYPSYWYYPSVVCYYPTYWYPRYYYGWWDPYPYYGGYYSSNYKYRTNDVSKIRNNSGVRNSGRDRDLLTSRDRNTQLRDQLKTRERQIVSGRDELKRERIGLRDNTRITTREKTRDKESIRNNDNRIKTPTRTNEVIRENDTFRKTERDVIRDTRKKTNDTRINTQKRTETEKKNPTIKRDGNNKNSEIRKKDVPKENRTKNPTINKNPNTNKNNTNRNNTPNRNYTPPKTNNTPRSYSPPPNNTTSPPRGNTNSSPRGNSGNNNSGRRR
ncbi:MAG: hypothetical protein ROY99_12855 [Ignavibacterium sp.]|jgi:hypothetical protein|nr:hypothetical protein [Ignavibacterium sp.]